MIVTDDTWFMVRNTPSVTGFLGSSGGGAKPFPVAEAEIEYAEDKTTSIYVKFAVKNDNGLFEGLSNVYFVIWTTTTWTLPGNVAVCLGPNYEYTFVKVEDEESKFCSKCGAQL